MKPTDKIMPLPPVDPSMVDPTAAAPDAAPAANQDMAIIQVPHELLATLATVLPVFTQMVVAAAEKSGSDIQAQKAQAGEAPAGAPGTMAPDQNSPDVLAAELSKMRR